MKQKQLIRTYSAPLLLLTAIACSVKEPCDPDQTEFFGQCQDIPEESGDGDSGDGGAGGVVDGTDVPNIGADCEKQTDCTGQTVCGAESNFPYCLALCSEGMPFEGACPSGTECVEAQAGTSICMADDTGEDEPVEEAPNFGATCTEHSECHGGTVCGADGGLPQCIGLCGAGDPFEEKCPAETTCTQAGPDTSVCL